MQILRCRSRKFLRRNVKFQITSFKGEIKYSLQQIDLEPHCNIMHQLNMLY